ncbi:MAG: hypothetical protein M0P69_16520 [Bacteroidales bacterium]|nr:hypothetical protein [Bacteroidales bacterium]
MTLNGLQIDGKNVRISNVDSTAMNTAVDGSVHGYHFGSHKQISFDVDWLSADDRYSLEDSRTSKVLLVLDTGEKYYVRYSLSEFQEIWIDNEPVYNVSITATEVVT